MVPKHLLPSQIVEKNIWLFDPTVPFLVASFVISCIILLLNVAEIHFVRKKWKNITRFEITLLNLAAADTLTGLAILTSTIAVTIYYVNYSYVREFFVCVSFFIMFSLSSASKFVIVIGIERLSAIRRPLKHRISFSSKSQILKWIAVIWFVNLTISVLIVTLDHHFNKEIIKGSIGSRMLGYIIGGYLLFCLVLIIIIYILIAYSVLKRNSIFTAFERQNSVNAEVMVKAAQKEKAAIVVCALVVIAYLISNVPIAADMLQGQVQQAQFILMTLNSIANPLIYFFKAHVEKYFEKRTKKKAQSTISSSGTSGRIGRQNDGLELDTAL